MYPYIDIGSFHLRDVWVVALAGGGGGDGGFAQEFCSQWGGCGCAERGGAGGDCGDYRREGWHELQDVRGLAGGYAPDWLAGVASSDGCRDGISALVPSWVCFVWRVASRDCDADVAGSAGSIERAEGRRRWG